MITVLFIMLLKAVFIFIQRYEAKCVYMSHLWTPVYLEIPFEFSSQHESQQNVTLLSFMSLGTMIIATSMDSNW